MDTKTKKSPEQIDEALGRSCAAIQDDILPVVQAFHQAGHHLYLVGGSVRDALLGRLAHDLDFTTDAHPNTIMSLLRPISEGLWDTGIEYGTVSALVSGKTLEITTFRSDTYDGHSRNPQVVFGDSLEGDLIRRDFRLNAMALELLPGDGAGLLNYRFCDPLDGYADILDQRIDTPSSPEISFGDDPLRMLRACRFSAQLGFHVSNRVEKAMKDMAEQITRITAERIQMELNKLMLGTQPWFGLNLLVKTGLAEHILPELSDLKGTQDEHRRHKNIYAHSLQVLKQAVELEEKRGEKLTEDQRLVLRWAALLHDCGKPATRVFSEDGKVSFHQHEVVGARLVRRRLRKLKYSKQHINDIGQLVFLHMRFHGYTDGLWTDAAVRRYVTDAGTLLEQLHILVRADCTSGNKNKARRLQRLYDGLEDRIQELKEKEDLAAVRPDLDGNEIMALLGLKPGPEVGQAWSFMKELRLERGPVSKEEATQALLDWWDGRKA